MALLATPLGKVYFAVLIGQFWAVLCRTKPDSFLGTSYLSRHTGAHPVQNQSYVPVPVHPQPSMHAESDINLDVRPVGASVCPSWACFCLIPNGQKNLNYEVPYTQQAQSSP